MPSIIPIVAFAIGAFASAVLPRQATCSGCTTGINVTGGPGSGSLGQLSDGQNRVGTGYGGASYCISNGAITDSSGRGCILTGPTTQFQCDAGATAQTGFSVTSSGTIEYNGSSTFYECEVSAGVYNIYTKPGGTNCSPITLTTTNSACGGGSGSSSRSGSAGGSSTGPASGSSTGPASGTATHTATGTATKPATGTATKPATGTATGPATTPATGRASTPATGSDTSPATVPTTAPAGSTCIPSNAYSSLTSAVSSCASPAGFTCVPSSVYTSMTGGMTTTTVTSSTMTATGSTPSSTSPTYESCTAADNTCRAGSNANESECSANYCSCLASAGALSQGPAYCSPASSATGTMPATMTGTSPGTPATATSTRPTPSGACPPTIANSNYQYPHLIIPVSSTHPTTAYGTSYNGVFNSTTSSIFNFDIPASYAGDTCTLVFLLPQKSQLVTSDYTISGSGGIQVQQLSTPATQSTSYSTVPAVSANLGTLAVGAGSSVVVASGACAAGTTVSYEVSATGWLALEYFQDYNPAAIGLYIVEC